MNRGWKDGSVVKDTEYFCRGPGFNSHNSQCPHGDKQTSVMPVPREPTSSAYCVHHHTCSTQTYITPSA